MTAQPIAQVIEDGKAKLSDIQKVAKLQEMLGEYVLLGTGKCHIGYLLWVAGRQALKDTADTQ